MKRWEQFSPLAKRMVIYAAAMLALVLVLALWLYEPQQVEQVAVTPVEEQAPAPPRDMILYFGLAQESLLYPETRQVPACDDESACLERLVAELAAGPGAESSLVRVLPEGSALQSVSIEEETVTFDFNARLANGHPGGSVSELLTVYALVDSVSANFPHLRQVRLLVDGQPRETLKGHIDISQPVAADFSWTRNPEEQELTVPVRGGEDG